MLFAFFYPKEIQKYFWKLSILLKIWKLDANSSGQGREGGRGIVGVIFFAFIRNVHENRYVIQPLFTCKVCIFLKK